MPTVIQRSFNGGEISPESRGRADNAKYATGCRTLRNFVPRVNGMAWNRAGTAYLALYRHVKSGGTPGTYPPALLKFVFSDDDSYVILAGHLFFAFYRFRAPVLATSSGVYNGATVYARGAVVSYLTSQLYQSRVDGNVGNAPNVSPDEWYALPNLGSTYGIEIPTDYTEDEVADLKWVQSGDTITITHPNHPPQDLVRHANDDWRLDPTPFGTVGFTRELLLTTGAAGGAGANTYRYRITAVTENDEETIPGVGGSFAAITAITQANPAVVTSVAHGRANGDTVYLTGIGGMTELNERTFTVAGVTANTFQLQGEDSTGHTAYSAGGFWYLGEVKIAAAAAPTTGAPHVLSIGGPAGSGYKYFNVFKRGDNDVYGFIGQVPAHPTLAVATFNDTGITPDLTDNPPTERNPFEEADDYPACVAYFQQRRAFGRTNNEPQTVWASRSAAFTNFTTHQPLQDDDAITFTFASQRVQQVRHLVEMRGRLMALCSAGVFEVDGSQDGVLTPTAINLRQQEYGGASDCAPASIGDAILYVQARSNAVQELRFDIQQQGYTGKDLALLSRHLVDGYSITRMDWTAIPDPVLWSIRDDGTLLGMTYLREQEVFGWHRHDTTDGLFRSLAVVPEGDEDVLYVIVERTRPSGVIVWHLEAFAQRRFTSMRDDALFLDCHYTYDGTNAGATTLTITTATDYLAGSNLTLTASVASWVAGDVTAGLGFQFLDDDGEIILTVTATAYTSTTVVTVQGDLNVPAALQAIASAAWIRMTKNITANALEGWRVGVLGDGDVVTNGSDGVTITVSSSLATLPSLVGKAVVGLPYTSDLEPNNVESLQSETLLSKRLRVNKATLLVNNSRGGYVGRDATRLKQLSSYSPSYGEAGEPYTGPVDVRIPTDWSADGARVLVRQVDPLPIEVLSVAYELEAGGSN